MSSTASAQTCPVNIDFELGSFQNWQCYRGTTTSNGTTNIITVNPTPPTVGVHEIIAKGTRVDPYGGFPVSAPDGSTYSVKLGNDGVGSQAERISYLFTVPLNQTDFVITYQYAVVLQDPGHSPSQQPRFTAKVYDLTTNTYVTCGSFDYVATASLPGFFKAKTYAFNQVLYKNWTPVSINLNGYGGHQLRLEFTTADCTVGGHFGYAYVDVNNSCSSLITGNYICFSKPTFTLLGPAGFSQYNWYSADRSTLLGTGRSITLPTTIADNTTLLLDLIPFTGFGCNYTVSTVIHKLPNISFNVTNPAPACSPATIDITDSHVTQTSDANLVYSYFQDAAASLALLAPNAVTTTGTYYIKATSPSGCFDIEPVNVVINQPPVLQVTDPPTTCQGPPVDITSASVTNGSSTGLSYSYWQDAAATQSLSTPSAIKTAGTYYIKGTNSSGCSVIKPVVVTFYPLPILIINSPAPACFPATIDITAPAVTSGSDIRLTLTYWADRAATIPIPSPGVISQSGTYYIQAVNHNGCVQISPVVVNINPLPALVITNPADLCFPDKADLTLPGVTSGSTNVNTLTYWMDSGATIPVAQPTAVSDSGIYYIKATSIFGCEVIKSVKVTVHQSPVLVITNPPKVYIPNTIDLTKNAVTAGSSPNLTLTYWNDANATDAINNPKVINKTATYYIKATNIYGCYVIKSVDITVATVPNILVPKAFTPTQLETNKLYPFLIGIKTFIGFKIYNRWGTVIFQTNDPNPENGWNGVYKGQIQFLDTFTWYAEGYDYVGNVVRRSGNTVLLK